MVDTVKFRGLNYQIFYVDNSLSSGSNDGLSITGAFHTFPTTPSLSGNSLYLIRRTDYIDIVRGACTADSVMVAGMPTSADKYLYNFLPLDVKNAWGNDPISGTNVYLSGTANVPWEFGTSNTNSGYGIFNLTLNLPQAQVQQYGALHLWGSGNSICNTTVTVSGQPLSGNPALSNLSNFVSIKLESADGLIYDGNDTISYGAVNDNPSNDNYTAIATYIKDIAPNIHTGTIITNSTFRSVHNGSYYKVYGLYGRGTYYAGCFKNLTFYNIKNNPAYGGYTHMHLDTIMNSCYVGDITGYGSANTQYSYPNYGIHIDGGTGGSSDSDQFKYNSKHTFNNIKILDDSRENGVFVGMYIGTRFTDCQFTNIVVDSPRAGNYSPSYGLYFYPNYNHHNKFDNLDINVGSELTDTPPNVNDTCGLYITQGSTYINTGKNYLTNSRIKSSRIAINASCLDIKNVDITGSAYVAGDAVEFNKIEVNINAHKFTTQQPIIKFKNDEQVSYYVPTNNVMKVAEFVNNSSVNQSIEYNYGLVAIECASGGVAVPLVTQSDSFSGKVYLNNYPQTGYWQAQNYWHKMEASAVQYVTSDNISGGFSVKTQTLNAIGSTANIQAQSLSISPEPFRGDTVYTSASSLGYHTATLYVATKFTTALSSKDIWVELEIPDGETGTKTKLINTYGSKVISSDTTTTWYGDSPLVKYKLEIDFKLERNENIYSRIHWNKSMVAGSAFAYIGPRLIIR